MVALDSRAEVLAAAAHANPAVRTTRGVDAPGGRRAVDPLPRPVVRRRPRLAGRPPPLRGRRARVPREMGRVARLGVIVNDLVAEPARLDRRVADRAHPHPQPVHAPRRAAVGPPRLPPGGGVEADPRGRASSRSDRFRGRSATGTRSPRRGPERPTTSGPAGCRDRRARRGRGRRRRAGRRRRSAVRLAGPGTTWSSSSGRRPGAGGPVGCSRRRRRSRRCAGSAWPPPMSPRCRRPIPAMRVETPGGAAFRLTYGAEAGSRRSASTGRGSIRRCSSWPRAAGARRADRTRGRDRRPRRRAGSRVRRPADGTSTSTARVVVGADGPRSVVARAAGVARPTRAAEPARPDLPRRGRPPGRRRDARMT